MVSFNGFSYLVDCKFLFFGLCLMCIACSPTYQSNRVYIPQHTEANQLRVELGVTQADVSYSVLDSVQVNVGGVYSKGSFDSSEGTEDSINGQQTRTESYTFSGTHVGFGVFKALDDEKNTVLSVNAGSAFQTWEFRREGDQLVIDDGYNNFNASIINPYVQLGVMFGKANSNVSVAMRYERPNFDFKDLQGNTLANASKPTLMNLVIQPKYDLTERLSVFGQFVFRSNLGDDTMVDDTYEVSSMNLYVGLSYIMDFASKDQVVQSDDGIEVEHIN